MSSNSKHRAYHQRHAGEDAPRRFDDSEPVDNTYSANRSALVCVVLATLGTAAATATVLLQPAWPAQLEAHSERLNTGCPQR
jgi:hypothetical protein